MRTSASSGSKTGFIGCPGGLTGHLTNLEDIAIAMQPPFYRSRGVLDRMLQRTFPDDGHSPAKCPERLDVTPVAIYIGLELLSPEFHVGSGDGGVATVFVAVPKASVDEHHRPVLRKHEVWGAGQLARMESIPKPLGEEKGPKCTFRPSVLSANARHHAAALRSGRDAHGFGDVLSEWALGRMSRPSAKQSDEIEIAHTMMLGSLAWW